MRKDQVGLKKKFRDLTLLIDKLRGQLVLAGKQMKQQDEEIKDLEQEVFIANIEHYRLLEGKPALTGNYAIKRGLAEEISEM
jgi:hypothetical protein